MRQSQKEIKDKATITNLLRTCPVGRLGTITRDGYPMVKPLNFVYYGDSVYFHTALQGEKIEDIERDSRVCFEVDLLIALVKSLGSPCRAEYLYQSVIIKGRAHLIKDPMERQRALENLMKKYQPEGGYGDFLPEKLAITGVVRIAIEEMVGKQDLGKDAIRETVVRALESGAQLPITIVRT